MTPTPTVICQPPVINPYWSDSVDSFSAIKPQNSEPTMVRQSPNQRRAVPCAAKTNTHGSASAIWSGRETRLGTSPEKMSQIWNVIEAAPRPTQIQR